MPAHCFFYNSIKFNNLFQVVPIVRILDRQKNYQLPLPFYKSVSPFERVQTFQEQGQNQKWPAFLSTFQLPIVTP
jgi:hypothetical protein